MDLPFNRVALLGLLLHLIAATSGVTVNEYFNVTDLNVHFMGLNSGLPGRTWPPGMQFDSTVDFTVQHYFVSSVPSISTLELPTIPDPNNIHCSTSWTPPNYPTTWSPCSDNSEFMFKFLNETSFSEANFTLQLVRGGLLKQDITDTPKANIWASYSSTHISANSFDNPTAHLTCMSSAPLTGIHCSLNGRLAQTGPIQIPAAPWTIEWNSIRLGPIQVTTNKNQSAPACQNRLNFTVAIPPEILPQPVCDFSWPCNQTSAIYDKIPCTRSYQFSLDIPIGSNVTEGFGLEVYDSVCATANYAPAVAEEAVLDWQVMGIAKAAVELKLGEEGNGECDEQWCSWEVGADGNVLPITNVTVVAGKGCTTG